MIINLDTGKLEEKKPSAMTAPTGEGRVIDLNSGKLVEAVNVPIYKSKDQVEKERRLRIEALPEPHESGLLSGKDPAKIAKIAPILLMTTDPNEFADIIATTFPEVGKVQTPEGEIILVDNQTGVSSIVNKPGASAMDFLQGAGIVSAFMPTASLATVPARIGGAIGTEAALQAGQAATGGEFSGGEVALAGGLATAGEAFGPISQAISRYKGAREIGAKPSEIGDITPEIQQAEEASAKTGIELFEAQKTGVPSRLEEQAYVGSLPAGTRVARAAILKQNQQAAQAVDDVLDMIAPPEALETGAVKIRTAAQQAEESVKMARKEATSPIFNAAFENRKAIDTSSVVAGIDSRIADFPQGGEVANALGKVKRYISGGKNLRQLHNAKLEIDQMFSRIGENSLGNTTKRELTEVRNELLQLMDDASPLYKQAREEFARMSPEVESFNQSVLGRIASFDDKQLKSVSQRIFDPAETNPQLISQARKAVEDIDPQAWREITRTELERRLGTVRADMSDVAGGAAMTIDNVPNQLHRAIFGNEKQRKVLYQGAPPDVAQNLRFLEIALQRAQLGRPGGSQTAARQNIEGRLRLSVPRVIAEFLTAGAPRTAGAVESVVYERRVESLTKALYSTEWKPRMSEIRRMNPASEAAGKAMLQLLNDIEASEEEG